jgi:amino acid transporter
MSHSEATASNKLRRNAIGLPTVIFQSVTYMGPAIAVALSLTPGFALAGGALPLSMIVALVAVLCVASSIAQLARHLPPSAGGLYTYASRGLNPDIGFFVAWFITVAYFLALPFLTVIFGNLVGGVFNSEFGWPFTPTWITATVLITILVLALNYFGVRPSTRTGVVLGALELLVFAALAITLIIEAGGNNTVAVFGTHYANVKGFVGGSGIFAGSVFTILALIGFEAAAPLGEETRNPRRNIKLAVLISAFGIGVFYLLTAYAAVVYYGPARVGSSFATLDNGNPWNYLAKSVWGIGWVIAFLAVLNSTIASSNAVTLAGSRLWFGMGRIQLFPRSLGRTHPRWKSPHISAIVIAVLSLPVALWLGAKYSPLTAFALIGTLYTGILIIIYAIVSIACIWYFARKAPRSEYNVFLHLIVPVLGIITLVPAFLTTLGIGGSSYLPFITPLKYPLSLVSPALIALIVIIVILFVWTRIKHRDRMAALDEVFADEVALDEEIRPVV